MIVRTLKLKLTKAQEAKLNQWLWHLAGVYNWAIKKIERNAANKIYFSQKDFQNLLAEHSNRMEIPSHTLQGTLTQAYTAWQRCFRKLAKKPRLKGKRNKLNSIPFPDPMKPPKDNRISIPDLLDAIFESPWKSLRYRRDTWEKNVKAFLYGSAYEWTPGEFAASRDEATGGLIIVRQDDSLVLEAWRDLGILINGLYDSAKLDTGSRKRHDFGYVYESWEHGSSTFPNCNNLDTMRLSVGDLEKKTKVPLHGLDKSKMLDLVRRVHLHYQYPEDKKKHRNFTWTCDSLRGVFADRYINIGIGIRLNKQRKKSKGAK